ncbi:hypothetical protein PL321_16390 [Caloramator sp. mosi_1]|uniref:hypothetical protein n=1 Tax=Caloramator sp. mosi_1 TaxID=3023090 RepID=UPI002362C332|nr:hypothetical protein [Caloramator sp. mosi_1]WDC83952.1 hypothetical protein PL321_16390 [Caloramator sp. mosi_1]
MAQFSALEQMQNLNSTMEKMYVSQRFNQAINIIGKEVEILENNEVKKVLVESVKMIGYDIYLISNEKDIILMTLLVSIYLL